MGLNIAMWFFKSDIRNTALARPRAGGCPARGRCQLFTYCNEVISSKDINSNYWGSYIAFLEARMQINNSNF